jgi:putative heme-binding domain-containing protein
MLAPSLAGSPRVRGHKERLTRILLNGLIGPVDKKMFAAGLMLPMGANDDKWIADVANYVRNSWNNRAPLIEASDVKRIRAASRERVGPWTLSELVPFDPPALKDRKTWQLTSSHKTDKLAFAIDGNQGSRWDTATTQKPGMWFRIELPEPTRVLALTLDTRGSNDDYPRGYLVHISDDGRTWGDPVAEGRGSHPVTEIELDDPKPTQHIRITQTGRSGSKYWSIHELLIKGLPASAGEFGASLAKLLGDESPKQLATEARSTGDVKRGAALFYNQTLSCVKCHDPATGARLGPDLASKRDGVSDEFLVESVLLPSKAIRKGFEPLIVQTETGLVLTGFRVREDAETLVIREPAGGQEIKLAKDEILGQKIGTISMMPPGLVNQLTGRQQFLDLVRFLMEINSGGPNRLRELKQDLENR